MTALVVTLLTNFSPLVVALVTWLGAEATRLVRAKTQNELLTTALGRLADVVTTVVKELEQTIVTELKNAAADGVLSKEDVERVRQAAIDKVKSYLGVNGLELLGRVLRLDKGGVEAFIKSKIEAAVLNLKLAPPVVTAANNAVSLSVIRALDQKIAEELKNAAADGVISAEELDQVRDAAVAEVKLHLGAYGMDVLARVLKLDEGSADIYIKTKIDAAATALLAKSAEATK